jgi:hypothetical protein
MLPPGITKGACTAIASTPIPLGIVDQLAEAAARTAEAAEDTVEHIVEDSVVYTAAAAADDRRIAHSLGATPFYHWS